MSILGRTVEQSKVKPKRCDEANGCKSHDGVEVVKSSFNHHLIRLRPIAKVANFGKLKHQNRGASFFATQIPAIFFYLEICIIT